MVAYGQGRSYGDVAQNSRGVLLATQRLDRLIAFDPATGLLQAEAGARIADIHALTRPHGWMLPAVPGTQFVSLGGALANDVHGKNHHRAGTFGEHVTAFELLRSDGTRRTCTPSSHAGWFRATVAGLGLTGLVTRVDVQLRRIGSDLVAAQTLPCTSVEDFVEQCAAADATYEYTVAWFDCFSWRNARFRGLFMRANHAEETAPRAACRARSRNVPLVPPVGLLHPVAMRLFNRAWHARSTRHGARVQHTSLDAFLYPLDGIGHWNRLYGPAGFLQFQCVIPTAAAVDGTRRLLERITASRQGTFLAVLKQFGDRPRQGILSFARPGITLALDFPFRGDGTLALFEELHAIVRDHGGAIYPAKDAVMRPRTFETGFAQWRDILPYRDPAFSSDFWRRVTGEDAA